MFSSKHYISSYIFLFIHCVIFVVGSFVRLVGFGFDRMYISTYIILLRTEISRQTCICSCICLFFFLHVCLYVCEPIILVCMHWQLKKKIEIGRNGSLFLYILLFYYTSMYAAFNDDMPRRSAYVWMCVSVYYSLRQYRCVSAVCESLTRSHSLYKHIRMSVWYVALFVYLLVRVFEYVLVARSSLRTARIMEWNFIAI